LVVVSDNGQIRLIDIRQCKIIRSRRLSREDAITSADWHPKGESILTFSNFLHANRSKVHLLNADDLAVVHTVPFENDLVSSLKWSHAGRCFAAATTGRSIYLVEVEGTKATQMLVGHQSEIEALAWTDHDRQLLSCGEDTEVRIWTLENEQKYQIVYRHEKQVSDLKLSPDERLAVSGGYDGKLIAYHLPAEMVVNQVKAYPKNHVHQISFSPDGKKLLTGCDCRIARMWDTTTWKKKLDITGFRDWVEGLAWSPDGKRYAIGDVKISIFSASRQRHPKPLKVLEGHEDALSAIAWSPNGKFLASIGLDLNLILWSMERMEIAWKTRVHEGKPFGLDWSPDSSHVVTGGYDGEARVWHVQSGEMVTRFRDHNEGVSCTKWSPNGKLIGSTGTSSGPGTMMERCRVGI
jgi:WD40 repeat protein